MFYYITQRLTTAHTFGLILAQISAGCRIFEETNSQTIQNIGFVIFEELMTVYENEIAL